MKTLSIKNPWAYLIAHGYKDVENRTWKTNYRGKILIHTPKNFDDRSREISNLLTFKQWDSLGDDYQMFLICSGKMKCSAIIGEVEIIDCIRDYSSIWSNDDCWQWVLRNPKLYKKPLLNIKGKLGLWNYDMVNK